MSVDISKRKIAVLMGGPGSERDVSLATGKGVSKALRALGADVIEVDVRDENFALPEGVEFAFYDAFTRVGNAPPLEDLLDLSVLSERSV